MLLTSKTPDSANLSGKCEDRDCRDGQPGLESAIARSDMDDSPSPVVSSSSRPSSTQATQATTTTDSDDDMRRDRRNATPLDLALFEPELLRDEEGVERAFDALESKIYNVDMSTSIEQLLSKKALFEFVVSNCSENAAQIIVSGILQQFSVMLTEFLDSIPHKLLERLPLFLYFLPFERHNQPPDLTKYRSSVELDIAVLRVLSSSEFPVENQGVDGDVEEPANAMFKVKASQRQRKQAKKAAKTTIRNTAPFKAAGLDVPDTAGGAKKLTDEILTRQRDILRALLEMLRRPGTSTLVNDVYIPKEVVVAPFDEKKATTEDNIVSQISAPSAPSAYPAIQPLKSALYFENADGFGEWPIHMSGRAGRDLRSHRKNGATFDIILKKLMELSHAHFSEDNQKKLNHHEQDVPIFEAKMTRDLRLVYQIDCIADNESERQIIRVYGIYTHAQLDNNRLWESVSSHLVNKRGKDYRGKCVYRNMLPNKTVIPMYWPPSAKPSEDECQQYARQPHQEDLEELHSLLVLDKFVVFSQAYLNNVIADQEANFVFDVSPQEQRIIEHPSSCYVIGRSGTGKTTTMMFKMLAIEKTHAETEYLSHRRKPRQLFVTQSRHLALRVEEYFQKLLSALEAGQKTTEELARQTVQETSMDLIDVDDIEDWRGDLPPRFSELEDKHFPLFVTFDRLCSLIEKDLEISFSSNPIASKVTDNHKRSLTETQSIPVEEGNTGGLQFVGKHAATTNASFVTYDVFKADYWSHFPQPLTKGLDPVLVFSEFLGVIKGSEDVLKSEHGHLHRVAYLTLSHRAHSTFSSQRRVVYELFEAYQKKKRLQSQFDAADRIFSILNGLKQKSLDMSKVDFVYVDEVQDNLLIDAKLLRAICRNPNGLLFGGDSAQTISMGSAFRLNELRALMYREEAAAANAQPDPPPLFQLTMNYRSHGGIVNCASSVVDILTRFWPDTLDSLARENGSVPGTKPIFFTDWDQDSVRYEQFLFGDAASGQHIEFGATQCILVRDDKARDRLREQVGDIGVILTLYESKGLEFNDVLLYNFFADSLVTQSQWRVILNMMQNPSAPPPAFNEIRHAGVCHELKCLYVAITRGRKNVWIVDSSDRCDPIKAFWTDLQLIQLCTPTNGMPLPRLAVESTSEEWANTGRSLFQNKRFLQAMHCYDRAGMPFEKEVAYAHHLRAQARLVARTAAMAQERKVAFLTSAAAFVECGNWSNLSRSTRANYLKSAADCFVDGEDFAAAAKAYEEAGLHTKAVEWYRKVAMFDEAVSIIQEHSGSPSLDAGVAERVMDVARIQYFKAQQFKKAAPLFSSVEEQLEFVGEWELDVAHATLLELEGRLYEAAELHSAEGRANEAMSLYLKDDKDMRSKERAAQCILESFRELFHVSHATPRSDPSLQKVQEYVGRLGEGSVEPRLWSEILLFKAISENNQADLLKLVKTFQDQENDAANLLALEHIVIHPPNVRSAATVEVVQYLEFFDSYLRLLLRLAGSNKPHENSHLQRAFGFKLESDTSSVILPVQTMLFSSIFRHRSAVQLPDDGGTMIPVKDFQKSFNAALSTLAQNRVREEKWKCRHARVLNACLVFSLTENCNKSECPREHIGKDQLTVQWFNMRVRLHFQQILILQRIDTNTSARERAEERLFWLDNLCDALFPPFVAHGHFVNLAVDTIPEVARGIQVLREWLREFFFQFRLPDSAGYNQAGLGSSEVLSVLVKMAALAFAIDSNSAQEFISASPAINPGAEQVVPPAFYRAGSAYIVLDVLRFFHGHDIEHVQAGCLFLCHVLKARLFMDASALCLMIDRVFAAIVFRGTLSLRASLHSVIAPRPWILFFLRDFKPGTHIRKVPRHWLEELVQEVGNLLKGLVSDQTAYLSFERSKMAFMVRSMFALRICVSLCILGDNIAFLRPLIVQVVTAAGSGVESAKLPRGYQQYMVAKDWNALVRTARQSSNGSQARELVQLFHSPQDQRSLPLFANVDRIVYNNMAELPRLLNPAHGLVQLTSSLNVNAPVFQPRQLSTNASDADLDISIVTIVEESSENAQDAVEEQVGGWSHAKLTTSWSEAHIRAGRTILRYRRLKTRPQFPNARELTIFEYTTKYHKAAQEKDWSHGTSYRALFRGPIPILMMCVDEIYGRIDRWKSKAKKGLTKGRHEEIEKHQDELTQIKPLRNEVISIQQLLREDSLFHNDRDVRKLKTLVQRTNVLIPQVPSLNRQQLDDDMMTCLKAIVLPPKLKKEKPSLNTDDLDDSAY